MEQRHEHASNADKYAYDSRDKGISNVPERSFFPLCPLHRFVAEPTVGELALSLRESDQREASLGCFARQTFQIRRAMQLPLSHQSSRGAVRLM
jgi:hypothetical protein